MLARTHAACYASGSRYAQLTRTIAHRVARYLERQGLLEVRGDGFMRRCGFSVNPVITAIFCGADSWHRKSQGDLNRVTLRIQA
jgi:uncharacterized protein YaaW (UPF0174 family)